MRLPRIPAFLPLLGLLGSLGVVMPLDGCALRNIKHDDCTSDDQCAMAFGAGSTCSGGFCTPAATCTTGHDCRKAAGGGACVNGVCQSTFPTDPACTMFTEPSTLFSLRADGPNAPLVIGGIFSLAAAHDQALTDPIRLAVREINSNGGLNRGQSIGVVFCDNGGPGDMTTGDARYALDSHALDYLAGTLGVPYIVGPLTSDDALHLIGDLQAKSYPTVLISPSATSPALSMSNAMIKPNTPRLFWRTCPDDTLQGQVLATDVIGKVTPALTSVTVIYINDTYGLGLSQSFQANFTGKSTNLVPYQPTDPMNPTALNTVVSMANSAGGDAVLVIAEEGQVAVQILTALQSMPIASLPFFFTDGSMDSSLLAPTLPAGVQTILAGAQGTAPADPSGANYNVFNTNLMTQFGISGTSSSFLAEAYDATYVGAYGVVFASKAGNDYDGLDVAAGLAHLEAGTLISLGPTQWPTGTGDLLDQGQIDVDGTSGPLQFDPTTGEAPGAILVWGIKGGAFTQISVVAPP